MKISSRRTLAAGLIGVAACVAASAAPGGQLPVLKSAVRILAEDKPLCVGHTASPEVLDWNNDGRKDLLVGTYSEGKIFLFLNQGSDAAPVLGKGVALQAGGKDIKVGFG
jgi:hypothetical protein